MYNEELWKELKNLLSKVSWSAKLDVDGDMDKVRQGELKRLGEC